MIKSIALDLGGVVVAINFNQAVSRFEELGVKDVGRILNPFQQGGFFGDLEGGRIGAGQFQEEMSRSCGRPVSREECHYACMGFIESVPLPNLDAILRLRKEGYRVVLLSNTNPIVMEWALSPAFDGRGHALSDYFDALYLSYRYRMMKPEPAFFRAVLEGEQVRPEELLFVDDGQVNIDAAARLGIRTMLVENNADWTEDIYKNLR